MAFNLNRYFSIASVIGITIVVAVLTLFYRYVATSTLIEQETRSNVSLATSFANNLWPKYYSALKSTKSLTNKEIIKQSYVNKLRLDVISQMRGLNVVKVNIYSPKGITLFSTDAVQIGFDRSHNANFINAKMGNVVSTTSYRNEVNAFEEIITNRDLLHTLIPLHNKLTHEVDAVLEIHADITNSLNHISMAQYIVVGGVVIVLSILHLFLSFIVGRAHKLIKKHEQKQADNENKMRHQAYHDSLTGLPNKNFFTKQLKISLLKTQNSGRKLALMYIDLDRLKIINDSLGHDMGDHIINIASKRIKSHVRDRDTCFRWGGDEFTIIIEDMDSPRHVVNIAKRILESMSEPIDMLNQELVLTTSIGIAVFPDDCDNVDQLIKNANAAMYFAKDAGRNRFVFYSPEMNDKAEEKLTIEGGLLKALQNEEFILHYQPKVDADSGTIVGVEALIRWQHPKLGLIPPNHFIPALEETGLINSVGEWVLNTACKQNKTWQSQGIPPIKMSVNISARQFRSSHLVQMVDDALHNSGLAPQYLDLELTESMLISNTENAITTMDQLKNLGVSLSIDDFGSGYSSLSYLKRFPVDYLKIDRSFIKDIVDNEKDAAITNAITVLAKSLNMTLVAEGVEDQDQLEYLREKGCNELQGFLFSKPLPSDEITKVIDIRIDGNPTKQAIQKLFAYYRAQKSVVQ